MDKYLNYFSKCNSLIDFLQNLKNIGLKHAYLFHSIDEMKNINSCKLFSLIANCENENKPCFTCKNCIKILNNNSLDVFVYPKNKNIVVEDIKEIVDSCYIMPAEFNKKIYILNNFDEANIASQNKFLKTLEEPPKNVIFLLNAKNLSKVLDTIKSRCETIILPQISFKELENVISNSDLELNKIIEENCENELGNYLLLAEKSLDKTFEFCLNMLKNLNQSSQILEYSSKIVKDKENLFNYSYSLIFIFRDLLVAKFNENLIKNQSLKLEILTLSKNFNYNAIINILENLLNANKELSFNTNEVLIIDNILINILEEKYKWS